MIFWPFWQRVSDKWCENLKGDHWRWSFPILSGLSGNFFICNPSECFLFLYRISTVILSAIKSVGPPPKAKFASVIVLSWLTCRMTMMTTIIILSLEKQRDQSLWVRNTVHKCTTPFACYGGSKLEWGEGPRSDEGTILLGPLNAYNKMPSIPKHIVPKRSLSRSCEQKDDEDDDFC